MDESTNGQGLPSGQREETGGGPGGVSAGLAVPSINLPKGGGAIRGIGEKFAANPVTGTGSMTVPIFTSPGRSGFGPQLSLSYDSGAGNGPFGFGWSLSLPQITRKTDKGLPQYNDAGESDVLLLSGAEDLVPVYKKDADGEWIRDTKGNLVIDDSQREGFTIRRYRPRIEGLFARIERWTKFEDPRDVHWRSISKDNILTLYGKDANSRIADPENPERIFSWLICETRDDKGNAVLYEYKPEDGAGVILSRAHERNRGEPHDPRRTANRYVKRIRYGNRRSLLDGEMGQRPRELTDEQIESGGWMFEVVFDYDEHDAVAPTPKDAGAWTFRADPFSSYRAGFEVRTTRLCQRVLMFHHFEGEEGVGNDCLVRSTNFDYSHEQNPASARNPVYTFLHAVTQTGYRRSNGGYLKRSLPPVEFEYTQPVVQDTVEEVDSDSLENLPVGLDGSSYQWTDLHGEGLSGILTEQAGAWFYKRNLSPINLETEPDPAHAKAKFAPLELVAAKPNLTLAGGAQFMDLAGDGQPDVVVLDGPVPGLYEHDDKEDWQDFRPFTSRLNRDTRDPNLRFVDLDGDGHADVLITEDDAFVWHASLAEAGFGPARRVQQALDEEKGTRLVFADGTQSVYLADLSGDGLTDLVRIRNGEVCYWPNLGYCRFGAKITMDQSPRFDHPDQFDQRRIRLADIDGTGTTDIIYLHREGVRLYFNQSGNSWSEPQVLSNFPHLDDLASITPVGLLGNGTACLVWSSPLPTDARRPMCYVNLMGRDKPHLLVKTVNNLGAETRVHYAPSTKFYLRDKHEGRPWITRLPFPVHVVERVETYDHISRNRFVTRYDYHHGHFDGEEREFRGFGMVEQRDTEEVEAIRASRELPAGTNFDERSHVPPVLTKTWFHTGVYLGRDRISRQHARDYYGAPARGTPDYEDRLTAFIADELLPDTVLPPGLTLEEEREACRALRGSMLRQEVYAEDGTERALHPYTVTEQNFTVVRLQEKAENPYGVFFSHPREAINYHYERNPVDPRIQHALTMEVDDYGNVLKEAAIGYGRRQPDAALPLQVDRDKQIRSLITYTENSVTNAIDDAAAHPEAYRTPLPSETRTHELTGFEPENNAARFSFDEWTRADFAWLASATEIPYEQSGDNASKQKRLIEHVRTLYRKDDLTGLAPLGAVEPLALPGETYKLAFAADLLAQVFQREGQVLLPNIASVLGGPGADRGGYIVSQDLKVAGAFPNTDPDDCWWIPSGRVFLSPETVHDAAHELSYAQKHFFLPHRYRDPFGATTIVSYDRPQDDMAPPYDLLILETVDPVGNRVTVGERLPNGNPDLTKRGNDYRLLQPWRVMDPNRNRTQVAFDTLGKVVGTAVMGKPPPAPVEGDSLQGFQADLSEDASRDHTTNPLTDPHPILGRATTRLVYDLFAYQRTKGQPEPQPAVVYTLAREIHDADLEADQQTKIQHSFSYSDGFGREIQKKIQAEPEKKNGIIGPPRWVGSGWTIFNNKGRPVRQYEPFFTDTHRFEFDVRIGVSPVLFYDPIERVVATLHPNHTYEKVVFDPWRQKTWDVNDTTKAPDNPGDLPLDPKDDPDVGHYFRRLLEDEYLPTWYDLRTDEAKALLAWPDTDDQGQPIPDNVKRRTTEERAAEKASVHANTPSVAHFDTLGRPFLTVALNKFERKKPDKTIEIIEEPPFQTRVELDVEGNQRAVRDAIEQNGDAQGRIVMRYDYDMLGNRIHQSSMEAGQRWVLNDVSGNPIRSWDSRGHAFRTEYDPLRRPLRSFVTGADPADPNQELLTERLVYGEQHPDDQARNLRGKLYLHLDQAGGLANEEHDFKGNLRRNSRRLAKEYKKAVDWRNVDADHTALPIDATAHLNQAALQATLVPFLEAETFTSLTTFDALNRPVTLTTPHTPTMKPSVIRYGYNEANLLESVDANLREATADGQRVWTPFVVNIDYDAKGQRQRIGYGNKVSTSYVYDPLTFRLIHMLTRRNAADFPKDCPPSPPDDWPGCQVQNLHYTYDPVGNLTNIRDDAQQTIFFKNKRVEPSNDYTYDAIYRLIEATGREHLGQVGGTPIPHSHNDAPRVGIWTPGPGNGFHPSDGNAMDRYCENYVYDRVGNIKEMTHRRSCPGVPSWTRAYAYDETSLIEDGISGTLLKTSNRLSSTTVGNGNSSTERYVHDAHGNMILMPHLGGGQPLPDMHWDHRDRLRQTDLGGGGTAYYTYDGAGQRPRKVREKSQNLIEGRLYLGGFEILQKRDGAGAITLERETLHLMDDQQRIALVETRTIDTPGNDPAPQQLIRYQLGNHLGSASLELDDQAQIISYEEYTPYGSTSYQAVNSQTEVPKRYRYTGKERDEETGLYYHGARYYAPWLGRWASSDPIGVSAGINVYTYVRSNPIRRIDPNGTQEKEAFGFGLQLDTGGSLTLGPLSAHGPCDELNPACGHLLNINLSGTTSGFVSSVSTGDTPVPSTSRSSEGTRHHTASSPPEEQRGFWSRGGATLAGGAASLGIGALILLSGPVGWVAGLTAAMAIAGGVAGTATGGIQLGLSYSGQTTSEQDRQLTRAAGTAMALSSPGGLAGGTFGLAITGDEEGLERGALVGGLTEAAGSVTLGLGRFALREYRFSRAYQGWTYRWNRSMTRRIREAYRLNSTARAQTRANPLFPGGREYFELSHFVPQRLYRDSLRLRRVFNRPWNLRPLWGTEHALVDPIRNPGAAFWNVHQRFPVGTRLLRNTPDWLQHTGYGLGAGLELRLNSEFASPRE